MSRTLRLSPPLFHLLAGLLMLALVLVPKATLAQSYTYGEPRFDPPALDAMLAPVALYPDPLLSQVLMAATYPREVGDAAQWLRDNPGLSGDAAVRGADGWDWDPSVRSLLAFPTVLQTLADHPSWTADLGEAFLVQREDVMDAIQQLRRRALAAGTLRSTEYTRVMDTGYAITIESVTPQTVYVPYYDPRVTYGTWWWPARPPMHWSRWPGYYGPSGRDTYVYWGPGVRLSSGFFFGNFVWSRREVRVVDVRPYYYPRTVVIDRNGAPGHRRAPAPDVWRHDGHRRNAEPSRDFGRPVQREARQADVPRAVAHGRNFDDRVPGRFSSPDNDRRDNDRRDFDRREFDRRDFNRRDFDRREPAAAPPRAPAAAVPAPSVAPGAQEADRSGRNFDGRGGERRADEGRSRQPPAQQAPIAQPRSSPQQQPTQPTQRFLDANEERPAHRRPREPRD